MPPRPEQAALDFDFVPSQTDGRPLYLQLMEHIRQHVAVGDWPPGTKLPSIRELAATAKVSVITVKRAYRELEIEGAIVTRHGLGSWVGDREDDARSRREELERAVARIASLARAAGVGREELQDLLRRHLLLEEEER
jgi:GntR family transcriptional regulator